MELQTLLASEDNVATELSKALQNIEDAKLVLIYSSGMSQKTDKLQQCFQSLSKITSVPVIGLTTSGAHFNEESYATSGFACGILYGNCDVQIAVAENLNNDIALAVKNAYSQLGAPKITSNKNIVAFADGLACDGAVLADNLKKECPMGTRIFGGMAGDDWNFNKTFVFARGKVMSNALVLATINVDRKSIIACRHGFSPIAGGEELKVTELSDGGIKTLNGIPAVEKYRAELERLGMMKFTDNIVGIFAKYPLGIKTIFGEGIIIRTPTSVGDEGEVGVNAGFKKGDKVMLMSATLDSIIESSRMLTEEAANPNARASFVFDCGGRYELIKDEYSRVVKEFSPQSNKIPLIGFTTYGEIAIYGGNLHYFHNYTGVKVTI